MEGNIWIENNFISNAVLLISSTKDDLSDNGNILF